MSTEPDYSRAALARFIEFVVDKNLVHPSTAQGWRVATSKVLEGLPEDASTDVRQLDVEAVFRAFLNRNPGRLSPASVGEYRRRVGRAIEEFVRWVEDPGAYGFRGAPRAPRREARSRAGANGPPAGVATSPDVPAAPHTMTSPSSAGPDGIALHYPLRADTLAQVVVPRDLTVEEARRMGAFLLTLAVDFRPSPIAGG